MSEIKKEEIADEKGDLLAIVLRAGDYLPGTNFYNKDGDFIQAGTWNHPKGHKIAPHLHREFERQSMRTQEMVYLKSGQMKSNIYGEDEKLLKEVILNPGDIIVYLKGGHDFEMLGDNNQVFEVKNGPYPGKEKDKKMIELK